MKDYNDLLDRVYELEGLLHLAVNRDNPPSSLADLIRRKGLEIVAAIGAVEQQSEDYDLAGYVEEDSDAHGVVYADEEYSETDCFDEDDEPLESTAPEETEVLEEPETSEDDKALEEDEVSEETELPDDADDLPAAKKFSFSINDRFRFRRTLFNNSDRDFNMAIASISACHSYREAEEMLVEDYGWNPEDIEVADFLRLVSNYFKYSR